ncbi:dullard-like phosphatase domain-containing protein [Zalerion maritima]|uniref:Dullard-like phosphatase domain-containing protein n=1 Tax=Zalerion maritima TaxID=339359 RepID=A0AAD5RU20_9PEZI|nr:dullard-like phosphatase domain-containing protein [Zalerion maritima]
MPSRSNSLSAITLAVSSEETNDTKSGQEPAVSNSEQDTPSLTPTPTQKPEATSDTKPTVLEKPAENTSKVASDLIGEETPLLSPVNEKAHVADTRTTLWHAIPRRIATTFIASIRWVLSALAAPGVYLWAYFCDDDGNFAPLSQLRKMFGLGVKAKVPKLSVEGCDTTTDEDQSTASSSSTPASLSPARRHFSAASSSSGVSSESEIDQTAGQKRDGSSRASGRRHSRSKSLQDTEEITPSRRSIRIKLHEGDSLRQNKHRKAASASASGSRASKGGSDGLLTPDISAQLKSPTSPMGALTKYPRTPAPPRPLIPRRQPSYINYEPPSREGQKTLVLDLDETLIHSMSKGGAGGQTTVSPQHPILYFVHKRPHCDEFLRRIHKWYNLVIFTASVQEYADPVIDWLESEKKYFNKRYYRQHCTFRHGAFIKDLSSVEPDLSKVMILDNSPLSYMFHQDNAIPIQGWINDPTDNDLQHLIPFLEGLQYVSDVRALLALKAGEDGLCGLKYQAGAVVAVSSIKALKYIGHLMERSCDSPSYLADEED